MIEPVDNGGGEYGFDALSGHLPRAGVTAIGNDGTDAPSAS